MSARKVLIRSKAKFAKPVAYIAEPDLAATEPQPLPEEPVQQREPWYSDGLIMGIVIGSVVLLALAGAFSFYAHAEVYVRPPAVIVAPPILFGQPPVVRDDQWQRQHEHDRDWERERRLGEHHES
jgi:hypothetical protein